MTDVHLISELPDGSAVGADDDNAIYRGQRVEVPYETMTVTTTMSEDGESFDRVVTLPDGTVFGHGTTTYEGFSRAARMQALLDGEDADEDALRAAWADECAITQLQPQPTPALVWAWTKEGA